MSPTLTFKTIAPEQTIDLRHRVMWPNLPRSSVCLADDSSATHFGAFLDSTLVAVASFFPQDTSVRLRKLAVEDTVQGQGIATKLLAHAIPHLRHQGYHHLWCDARVSAVAFYERNGFSIDDQVFQKQGKDYVIAKRPLTDRP